jgi:hypothetical protein
VVQVMGLRAARRRPPRHVGRAPLSRFEASRRLSVREKPPE